MLMNGTSKARGAAVPGGPPGGACPPEVVISVETYWWHLARARESRTRAEAAKRAWAMAAAAGRVHVILSGTPGAVPDVERDPLAWHDLSVLLGRLAMALDRDLSWAWVGCAADDSASCGACRASQGLAATVSRAEFAAAWPLVWRGLAALAASGGNGEPPWLRGFTAVQVEWAASAVIGAPW